MSSPVSTPLEQSRPELEGARISTAVRCPRAAVYGAKDAPKREFTPEELRIFKRGHAWGKIIADDVCAEYREQGRRPRREVEVTWPTEDPVGTGHIDVYVPHEHRVVEVFSTLDAHLAEPKVLQAAWYCHAHPRALRADVVSVDTHSGEDRTYPVNVDEVLPQVLEIERQVVAGVRGGELPPRACRTPAEGARCAYRDHCFAGWEWAPLEELYGAEDLVGRLADATDNLGRIRSDARSAEADVEEARAELERLLCPHRAPGVYEGTAGGVDVRLNLSESQTFSLSDARKAGWDLSAPAETLDAFRKTSLRSRWTLRRHEAP